MRSTRVFCAGFLVLLFVGAAPFYAPPARAQITPPPPPAYGQAELDRLLAPIALYPDPLLSQILMAATYPLEVAEAAAWSRRSAGLAGDPAVRAVQDRDWDPSVKSLVAFPNVLQRMGDNPEWTRSLGTAFLDQEPHVMETIQQLRQRARAAGNLGSDERQRVIEDGGRLRIEPVRTEIVYVPYYDPWLAYGAWRWPSYPPIAWAPWPGYSAPRPGLFIAWGPAIRLSLGFFFGDLDWQRRHVNIVHVNNYYINRPTVVYEPGHNRIQPVHPGRWRHDSFHRRGLAYADPAFAPGPAGPRLARPSQITPATAAAPVHIVAPPAPAPAAIPAPPVASTGSQTAQSAAKARTPHYPPPAGPYSREPAPKNGYPSPGRQMQLEQEQERREQARKANEPSLAQRQQARQEKERRGDPEYRQEPRKRHPKKE